MKTRGKETKKIIFSLIGLAAVIVLLLCVYRLTKEDAVKGEKVITLEVVHKDQKVNTFEIKTKKEYLGDALADEGLIEGDEGSYGLFVTSVDGEAADEGNQEWWCLTEGGKTVNTAVDKTPIADGGKFELTLTIGY